MSILSQYKILPVFLLVATLTLSFRLAELFIGINDIYSSQSVPGLAYANIDTQAGSESYENSGHGNDEPEGLGAGSLESGSDESGDSNLVFEDNTAKPPEWKDAGDAEIDLSDVKMEVLEDMAKRRRELDKFEHDLKVREALLKAAEQELERKYKELSKLKVELEGLLQQQSEEEQKRVKSLVKIYEGMKPKDAARIFDTLDIDVLVAVITKMSTRKVAPIMAAMNAERARTITIMMAEQKQLPSLPGGN